MVEGDQPCLVLPADCHVGQHQGGIDGIVEEHHAAEGLLHHAPLVDEAVDLLRTFVAVDVHHELVAAGGGFPVDGAVVVAGDVLADVFELRLVPHAADTLLSLLDQAVVDGLQLILPQQQVRGVDLHVGGMSGGEPPLDESQPGTGEEADVTEPVDAAAHGFKNWNKV